MHYLGVKSYLEKCGRLGYEYDSGDEEEDDERPEESAGLSQEDKGQDQDEHRRSEDDRRGVPQRQTSEGEEKKNQRCGPDKALQEETIQ